MRFGQVDGKTDADQFNAYLAFESNLRIFLKGATYDKPKDMLSPIPQNGIDYSLKGAVKTLKQNPGY